MTKKYLELALEASKNQIRELTNELEIQKHNNYEVLKEKQKIGNENADLRYENDELKDTLRLINKLMTCNSYNNEVALKNKIIELTSDYQSIS